VPVALAEARRPYARRMPKPTRFAHFRYLGDKRTLTVYDMDEIDNDPAVAKAVADVVASEKFLAFGPDTLAEARNRGYRPYRSRIEAQTETESEGSAAG
jgi:hypothetical protein